jgi:tRNA-(ms[2]io[6]A)-hydroxylase
MLSDIQEFLGCPTPKEWIEAALDNQELMLIDHGNCEKKAAGSALQLMFRYSERVALMDKMSRLAREELRHFEQVLSLIKQRGIQLHNVTASRYAGGLKPLVRSHEPHRLADSLVVGAFIEARSCERFAALAPRLDVELGKFYNGLLNSERRHFQDYLKLAYLYSDRESVDKFAEKVRAKEQELISSPDPEFRFHSGLPAYL